MVLTGLERVLRGDSEVLSGRRFGLIANPSTVDSGLAHAVDRFAGDSKFELGALFGPEHGIRGDAQYMVAVDRELDEATGLPVYSLYGHDEASLVPTDESLQGLDALVFDIQDVGARYYTYVWTMVFALRVCARLGKTMVVLDRPNPLGGLGVEGGEIQERYLSFVGVCSVPNRHGLTAGEIARMVVSREGLDVDLQVVEMQGWSREMHYGDTGLPWVMPSPNMPTYDTALVYPGMCLLEGTEVSEARGTTRPFELFGAPFLRGAALAQAMVDEGVAGAVLRPATFRPTWDKCSDESCGGVQIHVTDPREFLPYRTGVAALVAAKRLGGDSFQWRHRAYEFRDDVPAVDLLAGGPELREAIDAGATTSELETSWQGQEAAFREERQAWLLYR